MPNLDVVQRDLQERLTRLVRRVGQIEGDLRSPHDRDWPERANELQNDDVLESLDEMSKEEALQIRAALRRIDAGDYGVCVACRKQISAARLMALPTAVTCAPCAGP